MKSLLNLTRMTHDVPIQLFIAGLGNLPMPSTRHSIGQLIIDALSKRLDIPLRSGRGGYSGSKSLSLANTTVQLTLFKSKQLMNISGPSIAAAYRSSLSSSYSPSQPPSSLLTLSDSLSHPPLRLAPRLGGSPQGHNGLKSLVTALGGHNSFWQFRVGVGRGSEGAINKDVDAALWVLGRLSEKERAYWMQGEGLDNVLSEIEKVVAQMLKKREALEGT